MKKLEAAEKQVDEKSKLCNDLENKLKTGGDEASSLKEEMLKMSSDKEQQGALIKELQEAEAAALTGATTPGSPGSPSGEGRGRGRGRGRGPGRGRGRGRGGTPTTPTAQVLG